MDTQTWLGQVADEVDSIIGSENKSTNEFGGWSWTYMDTPVELGDIEALPSGPPILGAALWVGTASPTTEVLVYFNVACSPGIVASAVAAAYQELESTALYG